MRLLFVISRVLRLFLGPASSSGQEHLPATGPYIISPNHQSYLDPFIVCSVLPYRVFHDLFVVGAAEYFETPLMRWLARQIKLFPVDPDANLVSAMKASAFGLHHGKILMLFPGRRAIDRRNGQAIQEGRADSGAASRRADRAGGAARGLRDLAAESGVELEGVAALEPSPGARAIRLADSIRAVERLRRSQRADCVTRFSACGTRCKVA